MEADEELVDTLDPRVLSSVIVSIKMARIQGEMPPPEGDPQSRLLDLMHSPAVRALLDAATGLSERQGLPPHEALQRILLTLQEIDELWNTVLMKKGLDAVNSQYH